MKNTTPLLSFLWLSLFISVHHAQPALPDVRGCECNCMACSACDFDNCMTAVANGDGAVVLEDISTNCVIVETAVSQILGTDNPDCVLVRGSGVTVGSINTGPGEDCIRVTEGATVTGIIFAREGDDCVRVTQATTSRINGGNDADDIIFEGSLVVTMGMPPEPLNGQNGNDCLKVVPYRGVQSITGTVFGGNDDDCIDVQNSDVQSISGAEGNDMLFARCSLMTNMNGGTENDVLFVSEVTIQPTSTVANFINGADGDDTIFVESVTETTLTNGRIQGGGGTNSCCSLVDPAEVNTFNCDNDICPPEVISNCPRRLNDCFMFMST